VTIIRIIDLETTGTTPTPEVDRIIEVGWCDLDTERMQIGAPVSFLVNPERSIPPEASAVHHLVDDDVANASTWDLVQGTVNHVYGVFAAHNSNFEQGWITEDIVGGGAQWLCTYKCALRIWPDAPSHSNQALRYYLNHFGLCRATAEKAHRAGPDAYVTAFHLREMLKSHTIETLLEWSSQPALLVKCKLPKHKGILWRDVPSDYLDWVANKSTLDDDTKFTARHWLTERAA
jgi:exodeoxyribonuclease X